MFSGTRFVEETVMHQRTPVYSVEPGGAQEGPRCACCGNVSASVTGFIYKDDVAEAAYFVHWTKDSPRHPPNFDLIIGPWGDGADGRSRVLVAITYDASVSGGGFMVIDSSTRPAASSELMGRALEREAVIGKPIATTAFGMIDAIWLNDPRIDNIRGFSKHA